MSGMYCLWNQSAFASIHDYESWERLLCEDTDIEKQISSGAFVPINIRSDGVAEIEIRVGSREQPESLSERENSYLGVSSAPYLLRVLGPVFVSGIEHVEGTPSANCEKVDLAPGAYAATVNLIDWTAEPGMLDENDKPRPGALPDFVVLINPTVGNENFRISVDTFAG
jgi:hypothetical protein